MAESLEMKVGPVFQAGYLTNIVVSVIQATNQDVEILHRGSYVRVLVPNRCLLDRKEVESRTGDSFELPRDLEAIMPSFKGKLTMTQDQAIWTLRGAQSGN